MEESGLRPDKPGLLARWLAGAREELGDAGVQDQLAIAAASRAAILLLAVAALVVFPVNSYNRSRHAAFGLLTTEPAAQQPSETRPGEPVSRYREPRWVAVWARWDALWYMRIAEIGYGGWFSVDRIRGKTSEPPATGFYPLMPLLMRGLTPILGTPLRAALVIANAMLLVCVWLLQKIGRRLVGSKASDFAGVLLLLFPTSFFLSAPYSDSLGLALSLACVGCCLDRRFWWSGFFGLLAALSRPTGILLAVPIFLEWRSARKSLPKRPWHEALAALLPAVGLGAFLSYCAVAVGDPLAPIHRQTTWRGGLTWPPGVVRELLGGPLEILGPRRSWFELVSAVLFLALAVLAFRYLPLSLASFGLLTTLAPLTTSFFSFSRLALASFPAFLTAGAMLRDRPLLVRSLAIFFAPLLGLFAVLYFTWNWIG